MEINLTKLIKINHIYIILKFMYVYLRRSIFRSLQSIFMHDPISFPTIWRPPFVKHQGFSHSYDLLLRQHCLIPSSSLPESSCRRPIRPRPGRILPVLVAEEIPLILLFISQFAPICTSHKINQCR